MKYTLSSIGQASPATFLFFLPARVPARVPARDPARVPPTFPPMFPPPFPPSSPPPFPSPFPTPFPPPFPPSFPPAFPPTFPTSVVGPPAGVSPPVDPGRITILTICQLWGFHTLKKLWSTLVFAKSVTKSHNVTKLNDFM